QLTRQQLGTKRARQRHVQRGQGGESNSDSQSRPSLFAPSLPVFPPVPDSTGRASSLRP
ncbi:unnamed protein product, partial [Ectocarpus sp. 8 AP-2014]